MLLKMINYSHGCLRLQVEGACLERFLNLCAAGDVAFWDVRRVAPDKMLATVRISGFYQIRHFARKCMCRVRVVEKKGVPFLIHRYRRRYALLVGILCSALALWTLSGFVWSMEVVGCERTTPRQIIDLLEQNGVEVGMRSSQVDLESVKNDVLQQSDQLSFITINLEGTHAQVIIKERDQTPDPVPVDQPCDIVADKDGVISRLDVTVGAAQVKRGSTVVRGDVIASGTMTSIQGDTWYVHAAADVELRTWDTLVSRMSTAYQSATPTGKEKTRRFFVVGQRRFALDWIESEPFACYDKTIERRQLTVGDARMPLALVTETYQELAVEPVKVSEEKCAQLLEQQLRSRLALDYPDAQLAQADFSYQAGQGYLEGRLAVELRESCGVEVPLAGPGA